MLAAQDITADNAQEKLSGYAGIVIPDGFGTRGADGMIAAAGYARTHDVPLLALGMGMHAAVVEFARNVAHIPAAMPESGQADVLFDARGKARQGGTLESGLAGVALTAGSRAAQIYGQPEILERHRHRYVLKEDVEAELAAAGLNLSGRSAEGGFVEIVELTNHKWFMACQYHPEFLSHPERPHPLVTDFLRTLA